MDLSKTHIELVEKVYETLEENIAKLRLRKSDSAISVPFTLVLGPNPPYPERMPYAATELNSNSNAPADDPGIFVKTEVNQ